MKIHIAFEFKNQSKGGGYQFLKVLRQFLRQEDFYAEQASDADALIFNSHHVSGRVAWYKLRYPNKVFIHRVDGPMSVYTGRDDQRDHQVARANQLIADGTIYQSDWSRQANRDVNLAGTEFTATIPNAPDPAFFNTDHKKKISQSHKIKLVSTCWSTHSNKGFATYRWLNQNLDFNKYQVLLIGKSDITYSNFKHEPMQDRSRLSALLKQSDIFIFPSKIEACSNALLEALACGLPTIAYNGSSNVELLGNGGELFNNDEDIPLILNKVVNQYIQYQNNISILNISEVGHKYIDFAMQILHHQSRGRFVPKTVNWRDLLKSASLSVAKKLR